MTEKTIGEREDEAAFEELLRGEMPGLFPWESHTVVQRANWYLYRQFWDAGMHRGEEKRSEPICQEPCCLEGKRDGR